MAATINYYDWDAPGSIDERKRTVDVVFKRRFPGACPQGWTVHRADNGRELGWVIGPKESSAGTWIAYACDGAFRGDDINDGGYILDKVPDNLTKRGDGWNTITGATRQEVTATLIQELCREHATVLGFGRNYRVERYREDRPKIREYYKNGMVGEYPHDA